MEAIAMGFANAVLQLGLWLTGSRILERYGRFVTSESEFYQWGAILMLNPVLWGVGTALWVLLLRIFRRVEDWKVLIGVPLAGASCFTVILLALVAIT